MPQKRDTHKLIYVISGKKVPTIMQNISSMVKENGAEMAKTECGRSKAGSEVNSVRKLRLELLLEAQRKLNEIEEQEEELELRRLERKKLQVRLELALRNDEIDKEMESKANSSVVSRTNEILEWLEEVKPEVEKTQVHNCQMYSRLDKYECNRTIRNLVDKNLQTDSENNLSENGIITAKFGYLDKLTNQNVFKELPNFSGNAKEWPNFIKRFKETSKSCKFTNRENLVLLQQCLKGKARELVEAQLDCPSKVDGIVETLEKKFGREETLLNRVLDHLENMQPERGERMENLIEFSECTHNKTALKITLTK